MTPLSVCSDNPIWFSWQGEAVYLAGSHTWACLQERGVAGKTPDFDFPAYLDFMAHHGHNFLRLWVWEHACGMQFVGSDVPIRYEPLPWARTGPGLALDGLPRFDLRHLDKRFLRRLRDRVVAAGERGIFVAVMLFQGFSVEQKGTQGVDAAKGNPWDGHPFHRDNNSNGIDGDADQTGEGKAVHTLACPEITRLQEAYVRQVIDTLGDLDHIVWEIGNECHPDSVRWHGHMIRFIRECERHRPKQHLVGMTGSPIRNPALFSSEADWVSPVGQDYLDDPPVGDGKKLIVVDTDHIQPWWSDPRWVWRNLCRGNHFVLMDGHRDFRMGSPDEPTPEAAAIRCAMGQAVRLANRMDLRRMVPAPDVASSGYCLACPGREYLVFAPDGADMELDLRSAQAALSCEWLDPRTGAEQPILLPGGGRPRLSSPFSADSLLWLRVGQTS
jgi:hypothetical protein